MPKKSNIRQFSSYVKSRTKSKTGIGPLRNDNGDSVTNEKEMANILNSCFARVFTQDNGDEGPPIKHVLCNQLNSLVFTKEDIKEKIKNLKPASAPGNDEITVKQIQVMSHLLCKPLEIIFNKSIESGIVPLSWREANVTPIFKKGDKSIASNYRPVSLTSICGKIMESIIRDKLVEHLTSQELLFNSQHGFLKNKSCLTNLLEFMEFLTSKYDDGNALDIIYLDFSKAFDKVPKNKLLKKAEALGISGNVLNWLKNWLSDRRQRVVINGWASLWALVLSGVPQGSILGPILFLIFINDIDDVVKPLIDIICKFADDTKVAQIVNTDHDRHILQTCLDNLVKWSQDWGMEFNIPKCKVLHVGKQNNNYIYFMNGTKVTNVSQEKDIGVITHESLKPSTQCLSAAKNANFVLGQISRAFHFRDKITFLNLYKSYVRPHLEFAVSAWCPWTLEDIRVLENVQKRAINMISNLQSVSYEDKVKEVGIQTLEARRLRFDMIHTYKTLNHKIAVNPDTWFTRVQDISLRTTRQSDNYMNLQTKQCKGDIRRKFFSNRVVQPWNNLPATIQNAKNVVSFKRMYDEHVKM